MFLFENLTVYQKAIEFAKSVYCLTNSWSPTQQPLARQLTRAAVSIAANLAEGNGRSTKADRKHFFNMSRASIFESIALLEISQRIGLLPKQDYGCLRNDLEEMSKMESGLIRGLEKRVLK